MQVFPQGRRCRCYHLHLLNFCEANTLQLSKWLKDIELLVITHNSGVYVPIYFSSVADAGVITCFS
jgi:hypothetical protein